MEILISSCATIAEQYELDIAESTMQFNHAINSYKISRRNRIKDIMQVTHMLLRKPKKKKKRQSDINSMPKMLITVCTWWEIFVQEKYPNDKCLENFKCSRKTYLFLINVLRPYVRPKLGVTPQRQILNMIKGVSVEKQVAIVLYKLATCTDYSVISGMFGIHKSTVHKIFYKVILSINKHLLRKIIRMPDKEEATAIAQHCKKIYGIPQILGAIEFTHIPLSISPRTLSIFINQMDYPSCILQAIVDPHQRFRDISVKCPGSTESHLILENSSLYKYVNHVIPPEVSNINGINVPYKIVGNSYYPLLWWLLTKYTDLLTRKEFLFNECLSKILSSTNEAIAKLKARFIILSQSIDVSFKMAPQVISACCAIHNICERNDDPFLQDWLNGIEQFTEKFPQPDKIINKDQVDKVILEQRNTIRDYIEGQMLVDNTELTLIKKRNC